MNSDNEKELRKYKRFPFREEVLIDGAHLCITIDISEDGLYISGLQYFEKDRVIDVTIPFKDRPITVRAKVQLSARNRCRCQVC